MQIMLDIETLATTSNASIVSIGAIKFNPTDEIMNTNHMDTFYSLVDYSNDNRYKDQDTIIWWNNQSNTTKNELYNSPRESLEASLTRFKKWIYPCKIVWSNSPSFDCSILKNAFEQTNIQCPWKYYDERDVRTVRSLFNIKIENNHNSLDDCLNQVNCIKSVQTFTLIIDHNFVYIY